MATNLGELEATAQMLVAPAKGILAADESTGTIAKRLESIGVENTEANRRDYREMLFRSDGAGDYISGVILYDETIRQAAADETPMVNLLTDQGMMPGIKVDTGAKELAGHHGEKITEGLDGLRERCAEYFAMGARFAKWRAVIKIGDDVPSEACMSTNAHALARYAAICQEQGLVPIIEPEVLMDGSHSSNDCFEVTSRILEMTFEVCKTQGVHFSGALLKPNMIIAGNDCAHQSSRDDVATSTVDCLTTSVPHDVGGIVFLSGGQSDEEATDHLNRMNAMGVEHPWQLSYSYGRALQAAALKAWAEGGSEASQAAFAHRAKMNSLARSGEWNLDLEPQ